MFFYQWAECERLIVSIQTPGGIFFLLFIPSERLPYSLKINNRNIFPYLENKTLPHTTRAIKVAKMRRHSRLRGKIRRSHGEMPLETKMKTSVCRHQL